MTQPYRTSRREFTKRMAWLAATMPLAQACAHATTAPPPPAPATPPPAATPDAAAAAAAAPAQQQGQQQPPPAEAEPLMQVIRIRYGSHLNEEQLNAIKSGVEGGLRSAERLRRVKLGNGIDPFIAPAWRAEG